MFDVVSEINGRPLGQQRFCEAGGLGPKAPDGLSWANGFGGVDPNQSNVVLVLIDLGDNGVAIDNPVDRGIVAGAD